ncbi:nicotinamide-nucleotide adenylyltransferase [Candidatus Peregrinibacteria bacterium]|nr:nicotinamide-nucleotide adenylyltransferase [Candidatus Peregrinibacteria bacterium]
MKIKTPKIPALFIGRFQPFHLGHLDALNQVFAQEDYVIIGIGSTEDDYVPGNPFTAGERYQMIEAAIIGRKLGGKIITRESFDILPARNIHHYSLWVKHIESLFPPFGRVYTGSPIVSRLFEENGGHKVVPITKSRHISATEIRQKMQRGEKWESFVPPFVVELIKKWNAAQRIRDIAG